MDENYLPADDFFRLMSVSKYLEITFNQIKAFPNAPRLYRDLYYVVRDSLDLMTEINRYGFLFRKIEGNLADAFYIRFSKGIFENELGIHEIFSDKKGIAMAVRIFEDRINQIPHRAFRFNYNKLLDRIENPSLIMLQSN